MKYPEPVSDYGPSVKRSGGRARSWGGAVEIEVEDRPDPTITDRQQLVRGARRRTALSDLAARGTITKRQHDAAIRFLDDCSLASGGGLVANWLAIPTSPSPRGGLPATQVDAIGRVRRVFHLLGLNSGTVFWWIVFDDRSLNDWDAANETRHGTGVRLLRAALTALDESQNGRGAK